MFRLLNALDVTKITNADEFIAVIMAAMDLFFSHVDFEYQFERVSDVSFRGIIMKCVTNNNVRKAGVIDLYECGCFSLRSGWYEAMGLNVEEKCEKCLLKGDDVCEINVTIKDWM